MSRPAGTPTITFAPPVNYPVATSASSVAAGDFNGDGKPDLAVTSDGSSLVGVLIGNGNGTFAAAVPYTVRANPRAVAIADVGGDGKVDLVVANYDVPSYLSVLTGNGNGTFQTAYSVSCGDTPTAVAIGHFDGDALADLAVTNYLASTIAICRGIGGGFFAAPVVYGVGTSPASVAVGDVNGDSKADLAVANAGSGNVSILIGNGNGTFAPPVGFAVQSQPQAVALGDIDADGALDLAVMNGGSHTVSVLIGNGGGSFAAAVNYPLTLANHGSASGGGVAIADFTGDGKVDLAVADPVYVSVTIFAGADGPFTQVVHYSGVKQRTLATADVNLDGKLDYVTADGTQIGVLLNTSPAFTSPYIDDPLLAGTLVKAAHVTQLRETIAALSARHGLTAPSMTDALLTPGSSMIRVIHIVELRSALDAVYDTIGIARPTYTTAALTPGLMIRRVHIRQLRDAERAAAEWLVLNVARAGAGSGTVTTNGYAGINCGTDCRQSYLPGTGVALIATPATGSTIAGWSYAPCAGTGCNFVLSADMTVTVTFGQQMHTMTLSKSGTGTGTVTSSPAGINCGGDCTEPFAYGTVVTLSASAAADSRFAGWSSPCSGTGTCQVTINSAAFVSATFNRQYTLTASTSGTGGGTITTSPAGVNCPGDCSERFDQNTSVTVTATPAVGSYFDHWTGACTGTGGCTVTMNSDQAVGAVFTPAVPATLTVIKSGTGTGTVTTTPAGINCGIDCAEVYLTGTTVTLTASAPSGSYFANWSNGCSGGGQCSFRITGDVTVGATFSPFSVDIDLTRGTVRMPNKYRTGDWSVGGGYGLNWVAVPPGWSVGGGYGVNWVPVPPGWSVGGGYGVNWIAVPPGWSVGGGYGINWVAVPPGWSVGDAYGLNFVVLPPGWSQGGGYGLNWFARPPGWSDGGGYGLNWFARPPGWSDGGGYGLNWVGLAPGWTTGGGYGLNWVPQPPGWTYGGGYGQNWVAHPTGWVVGGGFGINWVAYPSSTTTTLELAFDDPGWLAWFQVLKSTGAMTDSDLADVMMYVMLGGFRSPGSAPSGQWP